MPRGYLPSRETLFSSVIKAALQYDLAGILVWEVWSTYGDDKYYEYVRIHSNILSRQSVNVCILEWDGQ